MRQSILESTRETSVLQHWQTGESRLTSTSLFAVEKMGGMEHEGRGQTNRKGKKPGLNIQHWRETMKGVSTCLMDWRENPTSGLYYSSIQIFR